ncbi:MAG: hypothetical protein IJU41_03840 [Clostridia bacterium]|nr:hypothetical protein [Clostridia bacterium]
MDGINVYLLQKGENEILHTFSSKTRMEELAACKNRALYESKCASWTLLAHAFAHATGKEIDFAAFSRAENGKWSCPTAFFSISHTGGFCAVALSDAACGVDLEEDALFWHTHVPEDVARLRVRILAADEQTEEDFLTLWTKKESLYKCYGAGGFAPREISTRDRAVKAFRITPPGLTLSVCGEKFDSVRFFCLRKNKIEPLSESEIRPIGQTD